MSIADCRGGVTDLSHSGGSNYSWGGISYLGYSRGGDNGWGGSGVAESMSETKSGGGVTDLSHSGSGISAVVRSGVADLRYVRYGGGSCYGCHSGSGGVPKAVAVSTVSAVSAVSAVCAVAKANNATLLRFLVRLFSAGQGDDSQQDASLWNSRTLSRVQHYSRGH
jgi:hypothetical protein